MRTLLVRLVSIEIELITGMTHGLFLFLVLISGASSFAQNLPTRLRCLPDQSICQGEDVYWENKGDLELLLVVLDKTSSFESSGYLKSKHSKTKVPIVEMARTRSTFCAQNAEHEKICPRDRVYYRNARAEVQGVFLNHDVVLAVAGNKLIRVNANELRSVGARAAGAAEASAVARVYGIENEIAGGSPGCDEKSGPITGEDSLNRNYFAALLERGSAAPLEDFLKLWYPERIQELEDSAFFACEVGPGRAFDSEKFKSSRDCQPDTLYSWGPHTKISNLVTLHPDGAEWTGPMNVRKTKGSALKYQPSSVFTTISPVSTFGFGNKLMRFKIKRPAEASHYTIEARTKDNFHDFEIYRAEQVEAYAFGVPEMYDEIVRDIRRYQSGQRVSVYSEPLPPELVGPSGFWEPGDAHPEGLNRLYRQPMDLRRQDELQLKENLLELIRQVLGGEGRIIYSQGTCRNRAKFFSTDRPTYFNPFSKIK